jgi:serine/threonine-protein kinase
LHPGTRLGAYEIVADLGTGGMGEVYRARDTRLGREVAIKLLRDALASDAEGLARFDREARVLASLNHPNIATLHGAETDGSTRYLVMELVAGETLADRIARGRLKLREALPIFLQIARGLETAHERGVLHRDLKPANVRITPSGLVKILDFGLAKVLSRAGVDAVERGDDAQTLTRAPDETVAGTLLGTAAYMSPEQARGHPLDARSDIWSFGCMLLEALTARSPFRGDTLADTLVRVVERDPDWSALPAETPPAIRRLLERCLEKDAARRLPHIGAARLEIEDALAGERGDSRARARPNSMVEAGPAVQRPTEGAARRGWPASQPLRRVAALAAVLAVVVALGLVGWKLARSEAGRIETRSGVSRLSIDPAPGESWVISSQDPDVAISPDGHRIAYVGRIGAEHRLMTRRLDQFDNVSLGSFGGSVRHPFFSPDGAWVAFVDGNVLKKVAVDGGATVNLAVLPGYMLGATWASSGIYFGTLNAGLFRVPDSGGERIAVPTEAHASGLRVGWPEVLPGENVILFAAMNVQGSFDIRVRSVDSGVEKVVVQSGICPRYASTGHLLYGADGVLWAVRFDLDRLAVVGDPVPILDGVLIKGTRPGGQGAADFAFSRDGTLVYRPAVAASGSTLVWVDRDGREEPLGFDAAEYGRLQISPDGSKIAVELTDLDLDSTDVWTGDVGGRVLRQLTLDTPVDSSPVWTRDSQRVLFNSDRDGGGVFSMRADGSGRVERLRAGRAHQLYFAAPDDRSVVMLPTDSGPNARFVTLALDGSGVETPIAIDANARAAVLSPDGRFVAYGSQETGDFEIYVHPLPNPSGVKWRITNGGGRDPLFARNGRELFYWNDTTLYAVAIETVPTWSAGAAVALFEGPYVDGLGRWYDIGSDGRFLLIKPGWLDETRQVPLRVVLGWFDELEQKAPLD